MSNIFNDGYEQYASVGINNLKGQWNYQRTALKGGILATKAFFDDHQGENSFYWELPLDGIVWVKTDTGYMLVCLAAMYGKFQINLNGSF